MKYQDRLSSNGTTAEKDKLVARQASQAKLQLQSDLLETQSKLEQAEARLDARKSTYPLDVQAICESMDEVEGYQKGLKQLQELQGELFAD